MFSAQPFCLHNADSVLLPVFLFPTKPLFLLSSTQGSTERVNPFAFVREREMRSLSKTGSSDKMWVCWVISPGARRLHEMVFLKQQHPKVTERVRPEIQDGDFLKSLTTGFVESCMLGYPHGLCWPELQDLMGSLFLLCRIYCAIFFSNSAPCCQSANFYAEESYGDGL